ncbi:MAG: transposase, partial [Solirubrobacteraceae bacterium]
LLSQQLREIYRTPLEEAIALLDAWLAWARRCRLQPFVKLARTITEQRSGIEAAIQNGLSNARVEQVNTQIRLIVAPSLSAATLGVQQSQVGVAAALANTSQQLGGSIGAALLSTIFATAASDYLGTHQGARQLAAAATVHGYTTAFWWAAGIFAVGFFLTLIIVPTRRVTNQDQPTPRAAPMTSDLRPV